MVWALKPTLRVIPLSRSSEAHQRLGLRGLDAGTWTNDTGRGWRDMRQRGVPTVGTRVPV